jgi:BUD22
VAKSLNWREPKKERPPSGDGNRHRSRSDKRGNHSHSETVVSGGADTSRSNKKDDGVDDEKAHPSWQAKSLKANTGGIVAFQGTKITFD